MLNEILHYEVLVEYEPEEIVFEKVVFNKDFGPWKKGDYVFHIAVNLEEGTMKEISQVGNCIKECKIELKVKE